MKAIVTDGQLAQLAVKQHELFARAKKGVYASFEVMLDALQQVIEGKVPTIPVLASAGEKFAKWRTFLIGGVDKKSLLQRVKSGFSVSDWAQDLMKQKAFTTLEKEEEIDTIILTPRDFGYERNHPTTVELLDPVRLAKWSQENAERLDGHVVELLPAEAGLHIRNQYKDQPLGEVLWIAMERITDSDGDPCVFIVERFDGGEQWLNTYWTRPDAEWNLGNRIVFRLRKVTQA
ncbi:MAG TPA: hypothetical protein VM103_00220 [Candidatus Paceibacterota bacterium]|nr:hypothetical protein [Candidatus Paceibacterota bacterium]